MQLPVTDVIPSYGTGKPHEHLVVRTLAGVSHTPSKGANFHWELSVGCQTNQCKVQEHPRADRFTGIHVPFKFQNN